MVWHQYVWEATTGNEVESDDDTSFPQDKRGVTFEDWQLEYSDVLDMMWNTLRTLMYDAHLVHSEHRCDFDVFCYTEHDPMTSVQFEYEDELVHIWRHLRRIVDDNGLHQECMRGATFYNFVSFCKHVIRVR